MNKQDLLTASLSAINEKRTSAWNQLNMANALGHDELIKFWRNETEIYEQCYHELLDWVIQLTKSKHS